MFFSRFFAVAVAALASVSFVSAAPTAEKDVLVKRSTDELVYNSLSTLNVAIGAKVDLINAAIVKADVSIDTIGGPCNDILKLLIDLNVYFAGLPVGPWDGHGSMPPKYNDCANIIVLIITVLVPCLAKLVLYVDVVPGLTALLLQIDLCLGLFLVSINFLLINVLALVGSLCVSIKGIVGISLFKYTVGCLGLPVTL